MRNLGHTGAIVDECDWCGAELHPLDRFRDRAGGEFCSKTHRDASTRAVKRLHERCATREERQ